MSEQRQAVIARVLARLGLSMLSVARLALLHQRSGRPPRCVPEEARQRAGQLGTGEDGTTIVDLLRSVGHGTTGCR